MSDIFCITEYVYSGPNNRESYLSLLNACDVFIEKAKSEKTSVFSIFFSFLKEGNNELSPALFWINPKNPNYSKHFWKTENEKVFIYRKLNEAHFTNHFQYEMIFNCYQELNKYYSDQALVLKYPEY